MAMTDEQITAAALADPDAQPLTPEQLARMKRTSQVKRRRGRRENVPRHHD
jgi:putative transcriptional regulator